MLKEVIKGKEVSVGDEVSFDGVHYFEIKRIVPEVIKTSKRELTFYRMYFETGVHRPMYTYQIEILRKKGTENV